jgi:ATP-dependent RNA helicase UAP56/SUB2
MGKTAVFILSTLQQLEDNPIPFSILIIAPTRELSIQIKKEYDRIGKHITNLKVEAFYGGKPIRNDIKA